MSRCWVVVRFLFMSVVLIGCATGKDSQSSHNPSGELNREAASMSPKNKGNPELVASVQLGSAATETMLIRLQKLDNDLKGVVQDLNTENMKRALREMDKPQPSVEAQNQILELIKKRPGLFLVLSFERSEVMAKNGKAFVINEETVRRAITRMSAELVNKSIKSCINPQSMQLDRGDRCENLINNMCSKYGFDKGDLYYAILNEEAEVQREYVKDPAELIKDIPEDFQAFKEEFQSLSDSNYYFCKSVSLALGAQREPKVFYKVSNNSPDWLKKSYQSALTAEALKSKCFESVEPFSKIDSLINKYGNVFPLTGWKVDKDMWEKGCASSVKMVCWYAYVLKNQVVLSYPTVQCDIRNVTAQDVESDISTWRNAGVFTQADLLEHSLFLDTINVCQTAHDKGYSWEYHPVTIQKGCKKKFKGSK